jgi:hypothetical protein
MVLDIVQYNDRILSPVWILSCQVPYKFNQKEKHRSAIVLPAVDRKVEISITGDCCYQIRLGKSLQVRYKVFLAFLEPTPPSFVCLIEYAFINVDQPFALSQ